jgi:hypothetical protein
MATEYIRFDWTDGGVTCGQFRISLNGAGLAGRALLGVKLLAINFEVHTLKCGKCKPYIDNVN